MNFKNKLVAITPIMCTIVFLLLGFVWDLWHPGWIVFLLIPVMPYLVGKKKIVVTIPLIITIIYFILGFGFKLWHPGWIIFLLIPVLVILFDNKKVVISKKEKKEKNGDDYIDVE